MLEFLLSQSTLVGIFISVSLATTVGLLTYVVAYKLIYRYQAQDLKDPTGQLFRMLGILVSLMLSLAFAEVIADMRDIEKAIEREVVTIADTFNDLYRYDADATQKSNGGDDDCASNPTLRATRTRRPERHLVATFVEYL